MGSLYKQNIKRHGHCFILKISFTRVWMMFGVASRVIHVLICDSKSSMLNWGPFLLKQCVRCSLLHHDNQRQWRVNNFLSSKSGNYTVIWEWLNITDALGACISETESDTVTAPFWQWASTKGQWCVALHLRFSRCWFVIVIHIWCIHSLLRQPSACDVCYLIMKMSVNRASTILNLISHVITMWAGSY